MARGQYLDLHECTPEKARRALDLSMAALQTSTPWSRPPRAVIELMRQLRKELTPGGAWRLWWQSPTSPTGWPTDMHAALQAENAYYWAARVLAKEPVVTCYGSSFANVAEIHGKVSSPVMQIRARVYVRLPRLQHHRLDQLMSLVIAWGGPRKPEASPVRR